MSAVIDFKASWIYDGPPGNPDKILYFLNAVQRIANHEQQPTLDSRTIPSIIDFSETFEYQGKSALEATTKTRYRLFASFYDPNKVVEHINTVLRENDPNVLGKKIQEVNPELIISVFDDLCNTYHNAVPFKAVKMIQNTSTMFGIEKVQPPRNAENNHNLFWILHPKMALSIGLAYLADEFKDKGLGLKAFEKAYLASFLEGQGRQRLSCINGSWFPKLPSCFFFQHLPEIKKIEVSRSGSGGSKKPESSSSSSSSSSSLPVVKKGSVTAFAFDGNESPPEDDHEKEEEPAAVPVSKKRATSEADTPAPKKQQLATDQPTIKEILDKYFDWDHVMQEFSDSLDNVAVVQHQNAVESFSKFPKPKHISIGKSPAIAAREQAVPVSLSPSDPLPLMWWAMAMTVKAHFSEDLTKSWVNTLPAMFTNPTKPFSQALLAPTTFDMGPTGPPAGDMLNHYFMALATGSMATKLTIDTLRPIMNGIKERLQGCYETTLAVQEKAEEANRIKTSENTKLKKEVHALNEQLATALQSAKALEQTLEVLRADNTQLKKDLENSKTEVFPEDLFTM